MDVYLGGIYDKQNRPAIKPINHLLPGL